MGLRNSKFSIPITKAIAIAIGISETGKTKRRGKCPGGIVFWLRRRDLNPQPSG